MIDYFRVRFPTMDALKIIRDVLQLKADYMLYEDFGKYGYESKYVLGDINIMCSMQEHLGVLLELKGRGCRQMESYLLAQERSWYDFMLDCMTAGEVLWVMTIAVNKRQAWGCMPLRLELSYGSKNFPLLIYNTGILKWLHILVGEHWQV